MEFFENFEKRSTYRKGKGRTVEDDFKETSIKPLWRIKGFIDSIKTYTCESLIDVLTSIDENGLKEQFIKNFVEASFNALLQLYDKDRTKRRCLSTLIYKATYTINPLVFRVFGTKFFFTGDICHSHKYDDIIYEINDENTLRFFASQEKINSLYVTYYLINGESIKECLEGAKTKASIDEFKSGCKQVSDLNCYALLVICHGLEDSNEDGKKELYSCIDDMLCKFLVKLLTEIASDYKRSSEKKVLARELRFLLNLLKDKGFQSPFFFEKIRKSKEKRYKLIIRDIIEGSNDKNFILKKFGPLSEFLEEDYSEYSGVTLTSDKFVEIYSEPCDPSILE